MATSLTSYLLISMILFMLGLFTIMSRRNVIAILMGIELILNAAALNFVAFSRFAVDPAQKLTAYGNLAANIAGIPHFVEGQVFAIFVIVLAAAEAVVAFAITIAIFKYFRGIDADQANTLRG